MKLDAYTVVFLRRPPDAPNMDDAALDALQQRHLAFWAGLRQEGHVLVNGPFLGQPDVSLRGVGVFRTPVEEASRLAHQDPSVQGEGSSSRSSPGSCSMGRSATDRLKPLNSPDSYPIMPG